ncbi:Restriction of telomere capping protein 1 [Spathaspora sp. JA1]|nr:Restriction of telomere capping protein 1 [Spathaspora sp. JA1]
MSSSQSNLARFAFNIYGTLNSTASDTTTSSPSPTSSYNSIKSKPPANTSTTPGRTKLVYHCDRETTALSQLNYPLSIANSDLGSHHAVIGGKNYLHLLCLSSGQRHILHDLNLLDNPYSRVVPKLSSINTIKTHENTIACGLSNGIISIYKLTPSGKSKLANKLIDHKRTINSIDFIRDREDLLLSGSQDGSIKLWDLRVTSNNKPIVTLQANNMHSDPIRACQYSPHSSHKLTVLSVHDSGALCKFDLRSTSSTTTSYYPDRKWNLHSGPALSLHIHPELEYVATAGRDQKICVFNYSDASQSGGAGNRASPEHMINTYGPIVKVRWSTYDTSSTTSGTKNQLFKYDIACSYLNDDSTVTVYNLKRKYIPKQIITSDSNKPISNFLWAQNQQHVSSLWCLTKSNVFTSYDLDDPIDSSITRPLDELTKVSMSWNNNFGDFSFVNQVDLTDEESSSIVSEFDESLEMTRSYTYSGGEHHHSEEDLEHAISDSRSSLVSAPTVPGSNINSSPLDMKPPLVRSYTHNPKPLSSSPIATTSFARPRLNRNSSASTTHDFGSFPAPSPPPPPPAPPLPPSGPTPQSRNKKLPQTTATTTATTMTSSPYVIPVSLGIPSNDEYIFRTLAMGYVVKIPDGFVLADVLKMNADVAEDAGVLRYASIWRLLAITTEQIELPKLDTSQIIPEIEPIAEQPKPESAIPTVSEKSISSDLNFVGSFNSPTATTSKPEHVEGFEQNNSTSTTNSDLLPLGSSISTTTKPHWHDLDNENLHVMNTFNSSPTSVIGSSSNHTYSSMGLSTSPVAAIRPLTTISSKPLILQRNELFLEKQQSSTNTVKSGLTMALSEVEQQQKLQDTPAWGNLQNLVRHAVDYSLLQGDIIFVATVALLLYETYPNIITRDECLEWIGTYVDILRRKRMFVQAGNIINSCPLSILTTLVNKQQFSTDITPKFFCCWCSKLLETTHRGYYYCQECKLAQSNCIYCHEPCEGLAIVVSLKCGHRGHFGWRKH